MDSLQGKNAIVCGSTQGIGWETAKLLAQYGANIVLIARNEKKLNERTQQLINATKNDKHSFIVADFSRPEELKKQLSLWTDTGNIANILVNNSGGPKGGQIINASIQEFIDTFQQHLICNHILVQAVFQGMKKTGFGRIINVISTSVKQPIDNLGVSNTIRGAVANWSKTLANEVGQYGITVNNVLPGATNTERLQDIARTQAEKQNTTKEYIFSQMAQHIPVKRIAEPNEIARAIVFLATSGYINGINLPVDGGRTKSL